MSDIESDNQDGDSDEEMDSEQEDLELQQALKEGRLQPGLNIEEKPKRPLINNKKALDAKYTELYLNLPWTERLDCTNAPLSSKDAEIIENNEDLADSDFKREMLFYRQAQAAVIDALPKLKKANISTKRPDDYYAQMAKSDEHMKKIREYLVNRKTDIERREKVRKLRELRTFGKKVQQEVLQKRQEEKTQLLKTMKKIRKGKKEGVRELEESLGDRKKRVMQPTKNGKQDMNSKKRKNSRLEYKNKKFGFGGKKRNMKKNTAESSAEIGGKSNKWERPSFHAQKAKKGKNKQARPGKTNRQKMKARK